nr:MAG TPA: hypothetical protein [Caudoviricetes sp.]
MIRFLRHALSCNLCNCFEPNCELTENKMKAR